MSTGERSGGGASVSLAVAAVSLSCLLGWMWFGEGSRSHEAEAGMVSQAGGVSILSSEVSNEEIVCVLDSRQDQLLVYRLDGRDGVQLLQRVQAAQLFQDARAKATGRK
jgi:hypothetical protein